jgi:hypothetical protein
MKMDEKARKAALKDLKAMAKKSMVAKDDERPALMLMIGLAPPEMSHEKKREEDDEDE